MRKLHVFDDVSSSGSIMNLPDGFWLQIDPSSAEKHEQLDPFWSPPVRSGFFSNRLSGSGGREERRDNGDLHVILQGAQQLQDDIQDVSDCRTGNGKLQIH